MAHQIGDHWISLQADYLVAETATPEQLLNDANLWLDQARALLELSVVDGSVAELPWRQWEACVDGLERLLRMAQGCVTQAHQRLLRELMARRQTDSS